LNENLLFLYSFFTNSIVYNKQDFQLIISIFLKIFLWFLDKEDANQIATLRHALQQSRAARAMQAEALADAEHSIQVFSFF
jgi:hypothetical protein